MSGLGGLGAGFTGCGGGEVEQLVVCFWIEGGGDVVGTTGD